MIHRMKRRSFLGTLGSVPLVWPASIASSQHGTDDLRDSSAITPRSGSGDLEIGPETQLFVDEFLIEKSEGLRRTVHSWQKHPENPILRAEKAWESGGAIVLIYGSVLFDEEDGIFKMWYYSAAQQAGQSKHQEHMCYATSEDGIHWTRPRLGIHDFNGARDNNICLVSEASDIETYGAIKDPGDPDPGRRYKMMFWEKRSDGRTGVWTATSPDGLHWTRAAEPAADRAQTKAGDTVAFFHDTRRRRYVGFVKLGTGRGRARFQIESSDFVQWTAPRLIMESDERDGDLDFYNNTGFPYGSLYLGFLQIFDHAKLPYKSRLELELIVSRDGQTWKRMPGRDIVLPVGPDGSWDRTNQSVANNAPVRVGGKLYLYYGGRSYYHGPYRGGVSHCNIGLATLRADGFASIDASPLGGTLTTPPLRFKGSRLHVNIESSWGGMKVALLDGAGKPLPGYTLEDCDEIREDAVDWMVGWKGRRELPAQSALPVRLHFQLLNTRLYAFAIR